MRKYSIYIIKNKINSKVYIGQTCQSPHERFMQHMKPSVCKQRGTYKIYNAINKYGKENFYYEVLEKNIDEAEIDEKEIYYIALYDSYENGYNSTHGGDAKTISTIQDIEKFKKMHQEHTSYEKMANEFNVNKQTIVRTAAALGLRRARKVTKEYLLNNKDIKTNKEMAKELNVSTATITRAFKKFNIKRGTGCSNTLNKQNQSNIKKEDLIKYKELTRKEAANKLGISYSYACKLYKKY